MTKVGDIVVPAHWHFRAPNGLDWDTVWTHHPDRPDRPTEVFNEALVPDDVWAVITQLVPAACPSHPTTPGFFPCGNLCALGDTVCPVEPQEARRG